MRIERVQHAVAGRVLDVAKIHVRAAEAVLHEREHVPQVRAHVPGAVHVVDAEDLLLRVDAHAHLARVRFVAHDDDLGHVLLHVVEGRQEHVLGLDALRVDVAVADGLEDLVDDLELREVVGHGGVVRGAVAGRDRRGEAVPQPAAVQPQREEAGHTEGTDEGPDLRESFEDAHCHEV